MLFMSDETWERHTNPRSVWTRFTVLPCLIAAIWSRDWIGIWAWLPTMLAIFWAWVNPRVFEKPASTNNWASKAVLGERIWINRKIIPVPMSHQRMPIILSGITALGIPLLIWGLWKLNAWPTLCGVLLVYAGKVWFLDRMVWLYEDMKEMTSEYARWLYDENADQGGADQPATAPESKPEGDYKSKPESEGRSQ